MHILKQLQRDEDGFILSIEMILVSTIAVLGLLVGISAIRDAMLSELSDVAGAVQDINQSWMLYGVRGHSAALAGGDYIDRTDFCDGADDVVNAMDNCVTITSLQNRPENSGLVAPTGR